MWKGKASRAGDEERKWIRESWSGSVSSGVEAGECGREEEVRASSETSGGRSSESLRSDWDHARWLGSIGFSRPPYDEVECVGDVLNGEDDGGE